VPNSDTSVVMEIAASEEVTMSAMTIGSHHRESSMLIVPSVDGFAEIIPPFWCQERTEIDWERRWQAEWDRRHVEVCNRPPMEPASSKSC
jgi:hypothetical protein